MTNGEKYRDEILKKYESRTLFCDEFVRPNVLKRDSCNGIGCCQCGVITALWLNEEYKEPGVDWSKVEVDTPIFVSQYPIIDNGLKRYFAKYEDGKVFAWKEGRTSFSANNDVEYTSWNYAKLVEEK